MAFKGYFDGGNQLNSKLYDVVTLVAISGTTIHWGNFDKKWSKICDKHGASHLHTTDALSLKNDFSEDKGWTKAKVRDFIAECVALLALCATRETDGKVTYKGLRPSAVSVLLKDYLRAKSENKKLWDAAHICVVQCANCCLSYANWATEPAGSYEFYFDRGEPFFGHIQDRWNSKTSRKAMPGWERLSVIAQARSFDFPGIQAADLLGWAINRQLQDARLTQPWQGPLLAIQRDHGVYDYDRLTKPEWKILEMVNSWDLPRRKPLP